MTHLLVYRQTQRSFQRAFWLFVNLVCGISHWPRHLQVSHTDCRGSIRFNLTFDVAINCNIIFMVLWQSRKSHLLLYLFNGQSAWTHILLSWIAFGWEFSTITNQVFAVYLRRYGAKTCFWLNGDPSKCGARRGTSTNPPYWSSRSICITAINQGEDHRSRWIRDMQNWAWITLRQDWMCCLP